MVAFVTKRLHMKVCAGFCTCASLIPMLFENA